MCKPDERGRWGKSGDDGGGSARSRSGDDGNTVGGLESLIGRTILIHLDSEFIPGFRVGVRRAADSHSCKSGRYPSVKSSAEFNYNSLRVCVARVIDQVLELVCKGNCGRRVRLRKREALAGDPKRKEWGSLLPMSLMYIPVS